jgi:hypothetical protein
MVIARAADVGMKDRRALCGARMDGMPIELVVEDAPISMARVAAASSRATPNGRAKWPGWQHGGAVMRRHFRIGSVDLRLVQAGFDDGDLGVVGHQQPRHAADRGEGSGVGANPIGQPLRPGRLGVGEVSPAPVLRGCSAFRETPRCGIFAPLRIMSFPRLFV